jgi:CP family cyanate transporter-like MFS transporter
MTDRRPHANIRLLVLWFSGACLRVPVLVIPPLIPVLHEDLHLSETAVGWLSSLPSLLFAIAAIPGAVLISRFGSVPTLTFGLIVTGLGSAARGASDAAGSLYAATILMSAGIALMQPALPSLVRGWFPSRVGFATAVYTNGLLIGEVLVTALTIPLVLPWVGHSWRASTVVWSAPVLMTALLVAATRRRLLIERNHLQQAPIKWWPAWRSPLVWQLGALMGTVNAGYFSTNAFLPDYLKSNGHPELIAAALTALNIAQVPASLIMLVFAPRFLRRRWPYVSAAVLTLSGLIGMMVTSGYWVVLWAGVVGFSIASNLILALGLPAALCEQSDVPSTSAGMFTISFSFAMLVSLTCGWIWDFSGSGVVALMPIALCGLITVGAVCQIIGRQSGRDPRGV